MALGLINLRHCLSLYNINCERKAHYVHVILLIQVNNRVGVKRSSDGTLHIYLNGEDMGVAATNVPKVNNSK